MNRNLLRIRGHQALAMLLTLLVAVACTSPLAQSTGTPAAAGPSGSLTIAQAQLVPRLDPYALTTNSHFNMYYAIWDPLSRVNEEGTLVNYLAESWQNESPTSWIVKLRKDVKWHDGSPFTAKDVVFSVERLLDPETKTIWTAVYSYVTGAEIVDDHAVRIKTRSLIVSLPQDFGSMLMMPKDAYEKLGHDGFVQAPIGTGPFKVVRFLTGDSLTLEANTDYFLGAPKAKTITFKQVPDPATRVAELLTGASDIVIGIPPNEVGRIDSSGNAKVVSGAGVIRMILNFALATTPELSDPRVREAAVRAIDVEAINRAVYDGKAGKQTGWLDKHSFGYDKNLQAYTYDPERARKLLADAGYANGMPITFMMRTGDFLLVDEVALAAVDYLNKAGFKVDYQSFENVAFTQMRAQKAYKGIYLLASRNSTGDPDQVFRSLDPKREDLYILDKQLEGLIDGQASEIDRDKRAVKIAAVDRYIHENYLAYNMLTVPNLNGVNNRVQGFLNSPFDIYSVRQLAVS